MWGDHKEGKMFSRWFVELLAPSSDWVTRGRIMDKESRGKQAGLRLCGLWVELPAPDLWYLLSTVTGAVLELLPVGMMLEQTYSTCIFSPSFQVAAHYIYKTCFILQILYCSLAWQGPWNQSDTGQAGGHLCHFLCNPGLVDPVPPGLLFPAGLLWRSDCVLCKWLILLLTAQLHSLQTSPCNFYLELLKYSIFNFAGGSESKESACNVGDPGSFPGLRRSPGGGHNNPFQYSCLENSVSRGAWILPTWWKQPPNNSGTLFSSLKAKATFEGFL